MKFENKYSRVHMVLKMQKRIWEIFRRIYSCAFVLFCFPSLFSSFFFFGTQFSSFPPEQLSRTTALPWDSLPLGYK